MSRHALLSLLMLFLLATSLATQADELLVETDDGTEIPVQRFAADGDRLAIWLPSEFGLSPRLLPTAKQMAELGIEVWLPDLHSAWFVPAGRYSLVDVPPEAVVNLIDQASDSGKQVFLIAPGRMAIQTLRGIRRWQAKTDDVSPFGGAILLHPKLYGRTPQGGESSDFLPIAFATNVPVYLIQPQGSAYVWRIKDVAEALEQGGASVYTQILPQISDGFNARIDDLRPGEKEATQKLPALLDRASRLLANEPVPSQAARLVGEDAGFEVQQRKELLRAVDQPFAAPKLVVESIDGAKVSLAEHQDKVVLINFWATWCPPCVEEIPSLERLRKLRKTHGLEVMAVSVGETAQQVKAFLADKPVSFPILLDPDGKALKNWSVYAFPTTFILDKQHRVRYALFGAFDWTSPEVLEAIDALITKNPAKP